MVLLFTNGGFGNGVKQKNIQRREFGEKEIINNLGFHSNEIKLRRRGAEIT